MKRSGSNVSGSGKSPGSRWTIGVAIPTEVWRRAESNCLFCLRDEDHGTGEITDARTPGGICHCLSPSSKTIDSLGLTLVWRLAVPIEIRKPSEMTALRYGSCSTSLSDGYALASGNTSPSSARIFERIARLERR